MKRIGLLGCGAVADFGHLPAIAETSGLELVAAFDPNPEAATRVAARYPGTQPFQNMDAFFQSAMDAVVVASPAPAHFANIVMAARQGKHILCEKPLGMNEAEIQEMIALTRRAGVNLSTALCYRFSPVAVRIKELIKEGVIGTVRALRLVYVWNLHGKYIYDSDGSRRESPMRIGRMNEGGPMVDCGVHQIDLALYWLESEIARQHTAAAWIEDEYEAPDHVWLHLDHKNGAHTLVEMSFAYCHTAKDPIHSFTYELIGTEGIIRYNRDGWFFEVRTNEGTWQLPGASEKNFTGMYHAWRDALNSGDFSGMPSAEDGLRITQIAYEATQSAIAGRYEGR